MLYLSNFSQLQRSWKELKVLKMSQDKFQPEQYCNYFIENFKLPALYQPYFHYIEDNRSFHLC